MASELNNAINSLRVLITSLISYQMLESLLTSLRSKEKISNEQAEYVMAVGPNDTNTTPSKVDKLLEILERRPDDVSEAFIEGLKSESVLLPELAELIQLQCSWNRDPSNAQLRRELEEKKEILKPPRKRTGSDLIFIFLHLLEEADFQTIIPDNFIPKSRKFCRKASSY